MTGISDLTGNWPSSVAPRQGPSALWPQQSLYSPVHMACNVAAKHCSSQQCEHARIEQGAARLSTRQTLPPRQQPTAAARLVTGALHARWVTGPEGTQPASLALAALQRLCSSVPMAFSHALPHFTPQGIGAAEQRARRRRRSCIQETC